MHHLEKLKRSTLALVTLEEISTFSSSGWKISTHFKFHSLTQQDDINVPLKQSKASMEFLLHKNCHSIRCIEEFSKEYLDAPATKKVEIFCMPYNVIKFHATDGFSACTSTEYTVAY